MTLPIPISIPDLLTFDPVRHEYRLTGRPVRSVTNILKKVGLIPPFEDLAGAYVLEQARARGTAVHKAIHFYNERDLDVPEFMASFPEYAGYLESWIALMASGRLETFACEYRVANFAPRYAGTFDWLGCFDGAATLIDFATGDPEDVSKHLQLAGYVLAARAWAETPGQDRLKSFLSEHNYIQRYAVRLHRDGSLPDLTGYHDPRDLTTFLLIANTVNAVDAERPKSAAWNWKEDAYDEQG